MPLIDAFAAPAGAAPGGAEPLSFTVVAAVNDHRVLEANLLRSPDIAEGRERRLLFKEGFASAALAYNRAIDEATSDLLLFVHQDVYLPARWFEQVARAVSGLDAAGARWGVLGCFGSRADAPRGVGRVYTTGRGVHGRSIMSPEPVETLDEIVLVTRRSAGLRFDAALPHFHLYGVDLCLQARSRGFTNYAVPAFCVHNTRQLVTLPKEFYACHRYVKRKWAGVLPIRASCMPITRIDWECHEKRLRDFAKRALGRVQAPMPRVDDPRGVLSPQEWAQEWSWAAR